MGDPRDDFVIDSTIVPMNAMLVASNPRSVRQAIDAYRKELDVDPGVVVSRVAGERRKRVWDLAAEYFGIPPASAADQIAITHSTTMGLGHVYHGIPMRPEQEVLTTKHEFWSTEQSLLRRQEKMPTAVRMIPRLWDDSEAADADVMVDRIDRAIGDATRILALTWVYSSTGVKLPAARIAEVVRRHNRGRTGDDRILFCLDGVHGFGIENVSFEELGCDYFVTGCHKWLFGPRGTGVVYGRVEAMAALSPTVTSFTNAKPGWANSPGGVQAYEHLWAIADAFRYHLDLGKDEIEARTHARAERLKKELGRIPVPVATPMAPELSSGIVCCQVPTMAARAAVDELFRSARIRASVSGPDWNGDTYLRFSPAVFNTVEDVDRTVEAVAGLVD